MIQTPLPLSDPNARLAAATALRQARRSPRSYFPKEGWSRVQHLQALARNNIRFRIREFAHDDPDNHIHTLNRAESALNRAVARGFRRS